MERRKRKSEEKERRRRKKAMVALLVFIMATLERKNCWTLGSQNRINNWVDVRRQWVLGNDFFNILFQPTELYVLITILSLFNDMESFLAKKARKMMFYQPLKYFQHPWHVLAFSQKLFILDWGLVKENCTISWIETYPVDSVILLLNSWDLRRILSSFPVRTYAFCSSFVTYMMYVTSVLLHKYTFVLMIKALSTHIQIFLKTESFFCVQKNTRPHAVYPIRFLPSTRKRDSVPYKSCAVWCMQKPPFPPSTPKPVIRYFFKKLLSKDRFRKPEFLASENAVVDLWTGPNLHFCLVLNHFF